MHTILNLTDLAFGNSTNACKDLYLWVIVRSNEMNYLRDKLGKTRIGEYMAIDGLNDKMMTVTEVSALLHIHPNTLRRWADKGIIKSFCITPRGDRRFRSRDIDKFLSAMNAQNQSAETNDAIRSTVFGSQKIR